MVLRPSHPFIGAVARETRSVYGERLHSIALFGSVARGTARPDSDLDVFLVVAGLPHGHRARLETFSEVERRLAPEVDRLASEGIEVEVSPIFRTPEDLKRLSPLLLDLTEEAVILEDRGAILGAALDELRRRLRRLGARRVRDGTRWYWDLKPDYRRGEIIRI